MNHVPRATYRLQFRRGFTLEDAAQLTDYLAALGISHLYASPYLQASPGSNHGYDVVDPGRVNEELGGAGGHQILGRALQDNDLGQILDIVPNHMAITGPENAWWWDVLENGPSSPYAVYFDVDWNPPEYRLNNSILLPILGDRYGRCVEAGEIQLRHERGHFFVQYYDHWLPVAPRSLADVLDRAAERCGSDVLAFIADSLRHLPLSPAADRTVTLRRHRDKQVIQSQFLRLLGESPRAAAAVTAIVDEVNSSPDQLDAVLVEQNYRLAFWRTATQDLGYRRFFDINTLVGLRAEEEKVFADTHRLILKWLDEGVLDGIRIDHLDGLRDPDQYLARLRQAAPNAWIVAEKILHPGEKIPRTWPVQGTTGYDFLNMVGGLFIDLAGEVPFTDVYEEFIGGKCDYHTLAKEKKLQVVNELFAGDVNRLAELVMQLCERTRRFRDYTRFEVNEALRTLIACFPVYRSYVRPETGLVREEDRKTISEATESAKTFQTELDPELFDFLRDILLLVRRGEIETEFVVRFQQLTGPVTAKGVEDTAFYCFNRFIALNEVGGDPSRFGISVDSFHESMISRAQLSPDSMLTTSTHDTKRSDDVRARLALLSEIPEDWADAVRRWSVHNEPFRQEGVPDRNMEYLLYQSLVGVWPIEPERVLIYVEKAAREAKSHTSWNRPDDAYERRLRGFVEAIIEDPEFLTDLERFVAPLTYPGRINSLSQMLIKLTAPGVPDMYQGTELWNLSLVDPDNRRPVDFEVRRRLLDEVQNLTPDEIMAGMDEGLPKLWVVYKTLSLRKQYPDVFRLGTYTPMVAHGKKQNHVVAYSRGDDVAIVVPRLVLALREDWADTWLELPAGAWVNVMTGRRVEPQRVMMHDLFATFPVALLFRET